MMAGGGKSSRWLCVKMCAFTIKNSFRKLQTGSVFSFLRRKDTHFCPKLKAENRSYFNYLSFILIAE